MIRSGARWVEAEQRRQARDRLRAARRALKDARREKRERLRALRLECREARRAAKDRAKEARRALIERHRAERLALREQIAAARAELRRCTVDERAALEARIADARRRLDEAAADVAWLRRTRVVRGLRGMTAAEARQHERDTTRAELDEEWKRNLFDRLYTAGAIRSTPRRSLGEAFAEWMHDHPADVWHARDEDAARRLAELEREEREAAREHARAGRRRRRRRELEEPTDTALGLADEWGGL